MAFSPGFWPISDVASNEILPHYRSSPSIVRPVIEHFQFVPDLDAGILNFRSGSEADHRAKTGRGELPGGSSRPNADIPDTAQA